MTFRTYSSPGGVARVRASVRELGLVRASVRVARVRRFFHLG